MFLCPQQNEVERNQEVTGDDPRPQRGLRERAGVLHRRKDRRKVGDHTSIYIHPCGNDTFISQC